MRRSLILLTLPLVLAGCRGSQGTHGTGPRMGPSLERLDAQLRNPALTPAQRDAYWEEHCKGRLIAATGDIVQVSDRIYLSCPPEGKRTTTVCVVAYPDERNAPTLPSLAPGGKLKVLGVLTSRQAKGPFSHCDASFELREARIYAK